LKARRGKKMNLAPIIMFCYNRPEHTKRAIEELRKNELANESVLHIFLDGPKNNKDEEKIEQIEQIITKISGFKEYHIYKSNHNKGLANSVINGVTKIINKYGKAIVLEDDIITSKKFIRFMNEALDFYSDNKKIYSISGYALPIEIPQNYKKSIYLSNRAFSWGWATWNDRWNSIDWDSQNYHIFENRMVIDKFKRGGDDLPHMLKMQLNGEIDSWAIRWNYNQSKFSQYTIVPIKSLAQNIGNDGSGIHCGESNKYNVVIDENYEWLFTSDLEENLKISDTIRRYITPKLNEEINKISDEKFLFMNRWLEKIIVGVNISNIIMKKYNVKKVSLYGEGTIGINLYKQLKKENMLEIKCFVDKENKMIENAIKCVDLEEYIKYYKQDELLIITPFYYYKEIEKNIIAKSKLVKFISIEEFI
jgi:hypothetical protein